MRASWRAVIAAGALTLIPWASTSVSSAQVDYGEMCLGVAATPNPVQSGRTISVTGDNAVPGTNVVAELGTERVATAARGLGAFSMSIPAPKAAGVYTLSVRASCDLPGFPVRVVQSVVITVTPPPSVTVPGSPRGVSVELERINRKGQAIVTVSWKAPNSGGAPTGYVVKARKNGVDVLRTLKSAAASPRTITTRVPYKKWNVLYVVVQATNNAGVSLPSSEASLPKP